jgi:hypothetical protein
MKRPVFLSSLLAVTFAFLACGQDPAAGPEPKASASSPAAATTQQPAPQGASTSFAGKTFGDKITATEEVELASIVADPAKYADQTVRTTGVVQAVCQKAGCWMEIGDDQRRAHIKMGGHAFLVPKTSSGHRAVVQGTVKSGAPQNECGSKDACGGTENGAVAKIEIVATGVEFVD